MMVLPNQSELDSIFCDLIRMARLGQVAEMQGMALMLKRLGLKDTINFIRNCFYESLLSTTDEKIYRIVEKNFK